MKLKHDRTYEYPQVFELPTAIHSVPTRRPVRVHIYHSPWKTPRREAVPQCCRSKQQVAEVDRRRRASTPVADRDDGSQPHRVPAATSTSTHLEEGPEEEQHQLDKVMSADIPWHTLWGSYPLLRVLCLQSSRTIRIPLESEKHASIAKQVIDVDRELQPQAVQRELSVEGQLLVA